MLTLIAYGLTVLLALGIIAIGLRFFFAPNASAAGYGVPINTSANAYLTAKGLRDLTYGVLGLVLLVVGDTYILGWFLVAAAIVPAGDTFIVLRHGGSKATAFGVHFATAVAMLITAALLFAA